MNVMRRRHMPMLLAGLLGMLVECGSAEAAAPHRSVARITPSAMSVGGCCATTVAWSPDGSILAVGTPTALRLVRGDGRLLATIAGFSSPLVSIAWSPASSVLLTGYRDGSLRTYSAAGTVQMTVRRGTAAINAVSWSADGTLLASAAADGAVRIYQSNGDLLATTFGDYTPATAIAWSSTHTKNGTVLAFATAGDVWIQTVSGRTLATLDHGQHAAGIAWSPQGNALAVGLVNGVVQTWTAAGTLSRTLTGVAASVTALSWSPDGSRLAVATKDRSIHVWSANGQLLETLGGVDNAAASLAWSPDSSKLVAANNSSQLEVWTLPE